MQNKMGDMEAINSVSIYPSPAVDYITIDGLPEGEMIQLYSLEGILIFETTQSNTIMVNDYPEGVYLVKIQNQMFKFLKTN
jgi:hypothetical protein